MTVRIAAHAKVNLFLRVLAREASGFHEIETLFSLLELADELTVEKTDARGEIQLVVEGADTGPAEDNLAHRAARLVLEGTGNRFGVRIRLVKRIPVRAGLGGGSSDGAATLHAVNGLAGNAVPAAELLQFAARLGSDVPFFAAGAPLALAWGRGERLYQIPPPKSSPALLVIPPFGVSTPDAYALLDQGRPEDFRRGAVMLEPGAFTSWGGIGRLGGNDFEPPIFGREPRLRELFERMAGTRPLLVRMSGSGSAVVGIYKNEKDRDDAALVVGARDVQVIKTATRATAAPAPQEG
jgi:4-diphosphocytidyl-2-C-methyl-D-erythritol kinase